MTGLELLTAAMQDLGVLAQGATPTTSEQAIGLAAINRLLGFFGTKKWIVPVLTSENLTMTAGKGTYTIGNSPSPDWNTVRPSQVFLSSVALSGVSSPVSVCSWDDLVILADRSYQSRPDRMVYLASDPLGSLVFYPLPDAAYVLSLNSQKPMTALATIGTSFVIPPEYERMLEWNLALELFPKFPNDSAVVVISQFARESQEAIKDLHRQPVPKAIFDTAALVQGNNWHSEG